uniref:Uncharacterized protein n=1 Tax=Solanum tuberosum TaxID=4113 RepID=M1DB53_SOLTU
MLDGVKKHQKVRNHLKSSEELLLDPTTSEALTSQPSLTTKTSDDEHGEEDIDVHARSRMYLEVDTKSWGRSWKNQGTTTTSKNHETCKFDGKKSGRQSDMERKAETTKRNGCYIYGGFYGYARCPELKSLGAILWEWKENKAQEPGQGSDTMQLGLIGLCGAITKQSERPKEYDAQFVD